MKLLHVIRMLGVGLAGTRVAAEAQPREFASARFDFSCTGRRTNPSLQLFRWHLSLSDWEASNRRVGFRINLSYQPTVSEDI